MITRYEIKFVVNHSQKQLFLAAAQRALHADPHGENACYQVTSVYFDSRQFDLYWSKIDGQSVRCKLRLRYYGGPDQSHGFDERVGFLELKHRIKDSVHKQRIQLSSSDAHRILEDSAALRDVREFAPEPDADTSVVAACIERLYAAHELLPTTVISYRREAWIGLVDTQLRVTFDQMAHAYRPESLRASGLRYGLPIIAPDQYVLEIKFNDVVPRWIRDIVVEQGLAPRRFSKYASGIEALHSVSGRLQSHARTLRNPWATSASL